MGTIVSLSFVHWICNAKVTGVDWQGSKDSFIVVMVDVTDGSFTLNPNHAFFLHFEVVSKVVNRLDDLL